MVTSDLGRVTTTLPMVGITALDCGDVRSRTSYNNAVKSLSKPLHCGDVRSRTSYNCIASADVNPLNIVVTSDLGRVTTLSS